MQWSHLMREAAANEVVAWEHWRPPNLPQLLLQPSFSFTGDNGVQASENKVVGFFLSQTRGWPCSSSGSCRPKGSRWQKAGSGNFFWNTSLTQGLLPLIRVPRRTSRAKLYLQLWQIIPCKICDYCYVFCWFVREKKCCTNLDFWLLSRLFPGLF